MTSVCNFLPTKRLKTTPPAYSKCVKLLQLFPTLCDPMDCSPPGSSVHGILQARVLEWIAMPSYRGSSQLREWTFVFYISCTGKHSLPLVPPG